MSSDNNNNNNNDSRPFKTIKPEWAKKIDDMCVRIGNATMDFDWLWRNVICIRLSGKTLVIDAWDWIVCLRTYDNPGWDLENCFLRDKISIMNFVVIFGNSFIRKKKSESSELAKQNEAVEKALGEMADANTRLERENTQLQDRVAELENDSELDEIVAPFATIGVEWGHGDCVHVNGAQLLDQVAELEAEAEEDPEALAKLTQEIKEVKRELQIAYTQIADRDFKIAELERKIQTTAAATSGEQKQK